MMAESATDPSRPLESIVRAPLFAGAPEPLLAAMLSGCETRELTAGERLLSAGQRNDLLYIVLSGALSVHVPGAERPHVRLGRGECVGELSIIDGLRASADVVAEEDTVVVIVEREQLWRLVDATSQVARNLLSILAGRVRHDDRMLGEADRLQRHFEEAATVDALTGLRNRRWLNDAFARQLDRTTRTHRPISILMIDADHFKQINDRLGHLAGDQVLAHLARTLAGCLRPQDLLARFGGEEFAVILPGVGGPAALAVAERLRAAVVAAPPAMAGGASTATAAPTAAVPADTPPAGLWPAVTVSIGVASAAPDEPATASDLLGRADQALYRAKQAGRNRVCA